MGSGRCQRRRDRAAVIRRLGLAIPAVFLLGAGGGAAAAGGGQADQKRELGPRARVAIQQATGRVRFIGSAPGRPIARPRGVRPSAPPRTIARAFLDRHGGAFGIRDQQRELRVTSSRRTPAGRSVVRFQQEHQGVPVLGGELVVNLDARGNVMSAGGEALAPRLWRLRRTWRRRSPGTPRSRPSRRVAAWPRTTFDSSVPSLWIYDPEILGGPRLGGPDLVWRTDVKGEDSEPIDEMVLVDAQLGAVALRIDQIAHAKHRRVCDADGSAAQLPCAAPVRSEGGAATGIPDVDDAYEFAGDTYDFYSGLGRDSLDGAGMTLTSTVRYCPDPASCPYRNAVWDGRQMVYGTGFAGGGRRGRPRARPRRHRAHRAPLLLLPIGSDQRVALGCLRRARGPDEQLRYRRRDGALADRRGPSRRADPRHGGSAVLPRPRQDDEPRLRGRSERARRWGCPYQQRRQQQGRLPDDRRRHLQRPLGHRPRDRQGGAGSTTRSRPICSRRRATTRTSTTRSSRPARTCSAQAGSPPPTARRSTMPSPRSR